MGREADQELRPDALTHARDRLVGLAHMHAVRSGRHGQVGAVVQDEERSVLGAQGPKRRGRAEDVLVRRVLLPQLEDVHAARERLAQRGLGRSCIGDEVEARLGESRRVGRHAADSSGGRPSAWRWCARPP